MRIKTTKNVYILNDFSINKTHAKNELHGEQCWGYGVTKGGLSSGMGISEFVLPKTLAKEDPPVSIDYSRLPSTVTKLTLCGHYKGVFSVANNDQSYSIADRKLFVYGDDKMLYDIEYYVPFNLSPYINQNTGNNLSFPDKPLVFTYHGTDGYTYMWISSILTNIRWKINTNTSNYSTFNLPFKMTSVCENEGVLYATTNNVGTFLNQMPNSLADERTIWYSENFDPSGFVNSAAGTVGSVTLTDDRGPCIKIISYRGNVYIFREYGITKLNRHSSGNYTLSQLYLSPSRIYGDTVAICGDGIIFLTRDGLHEFNGINVVKAKTAINEVLQHVDNEYACADCLNDIYYLSCRLRMAGDEVVGTEDVVGNRNNAVLAINIYDMTFDILRGVDVGSLYALKDKNIEKIILTLNIQNSRKVSELNVKGTNYDIPTAKLYKTATLDISDGDKNARLMGIKIDCSAGTSISVKTDKKTLVFTASKAGKNIFTPFVSAKNVQITMTASGNNDYVKSIEIHTSAT